MSTCNPQELITAGKCFSGNCLTLDQQRIARLQLLCEIKNNGGGGGGGVTSIIAGPGISVDQPTGAVTVSATGSETELYWYSSNIGVYIDTTAGTPVELTALLPGWTGAETSALLAAIQAGKKVTYEFFFLQNAQPTTPGNQWLQSLQMFFGAPNSFPNYSPYLLGEFSPGDYNATDLYMNYSFSMTIDYASLKNSLVGGLSSFSPTPSPNQTSFQPYPSNGTPVWDGSIWFEFMPTNIASSNIQISNARIIIK